MQYSVSNGDSGVAATVVAMPRFAKGDSCEWLAAWPRLNAAAVGSMPMARTLPFHGGNSRPPFEYQSEQDGKSFGSHRTETL